MGIVSSYVKEPVVRHNVSSYVSRYLLMRQRFRRGRYWIMKHHGLAGNGYQVQQPKIVKGIRLHLRWVSYSGDG